MEFCFPEQLERRRQEVELQIAGGKQMWLDTLPGVQGAHLERQEGFAQLRRYASALNT